MSAHETSRRPLRKPSLRLVVLAALLSVLPLLASTCFRVPSSASAPPGLYLLTYRAPARGAWVAACLPAPLSRFGRERDYLGVGACPGGATEVLKRVAALPGDRVTVSATGLVVNGSPLRRTARRARDTAGRPIPRVPDGSYLVAPGTLWVYSDEVPTSWDSRYFGAVPLAGVRSNAVLLLATPGYENPSISHGSLLHLRAVRSHDAMTSRSTHPTPQPSTGSTLGGPGATSLLSALASLLGAASFFTQRLAHHLAYHELLGRPWFFLPLPAPVLLGVAAAGLALPVWALAAPHRRPAAPALLLPSAFAFALAYGPLYAPAAGFDWFAALLRTSWRWKAVGAAAEAVAVLVAGLGITAALLRLALGRRSTVAATAHGSARFADRADLAAADLLSGEGLVLGALGRGRRPFALTDRSGQHALVVMPPGAGKTTGPIASSLLNTPEHSALVLDPKGELFELTAGWRADAGQEIIRFAPHDGTGETWAWNPLQEVPRGDREIAALAALTENLVSYPAETQGDSHWTASARSLLRCLLLDELYRSDTPSLAGARARLTSRTGPDDLERLFDEMAGAVHDRELRFGWRKAGRPTATHPEIARLARTFASTPDRERGSIVSTLNRFLDLWGDARVAAATARSRWNLSHLTDPAQPTTVYVTAPFNELARLAPLLRVLVALLVHRLTDDSVPYQDAATGRRRRVLLVLDEFASLGRIPLLEHVLAFLRGYGVTAMLAIQDVGQLYRLYTRNETFSGTCGIHVATATANLTTRSEISRRAGEATVIYPKRSRSGTFTKGKTTRSQAEVRRPLLTEGEVGTLSPDQLLILKAGHPAVLAEKLPYWRHPVLARRAKLAPPRRPVVEARAASGSLPAGGTSDDSALTTGPEPLPPPRPRPRDREQER